MPLSCHPEQLWLSKPFSIVLLIDQRFAAPHRAAVVHRAWVGHGRGFWCITSIGTSSLISPSPIWKCAESDNHLRQSFYHPVRSRVYNNHQTVNISCCMCRQVSSMIERTVSSFGRLDAAFNNAGVMQRRVDTADTSSDEGFSRDIP